MTLRDYLGILRRRRLIILLAVVVVVSTAVVVSRAQKPIYEASARLLLQPNQTLFDVLSGNASVSGGIDTQMEIITSEPVQERVRQSLGFDAVASVTQRGGTNVVEITARSKVPADAATIANAYTKAYIDLTREQAVNGLLDAAKQIQQKVDVLQKQIDELGAAASAAAIANQRPGSPVVLAPSTPERDSLISQQGTFKQKLDQLQVDTALKNGGAQVVAPARATTSPVSPRPRRDALMGLVAGLVLGLVAAFVLDHLDDSLKIGADLERAATGVSLLGVIPAVAWKSKGEAKVVSITEPTSSAAEAYRTLRTSITFLGLDRSLGVVQVTSPNPAEGKTTTLVNLAIAMANAGQRVIVIDCDLRRPRVHEFFGVDNETGFTSVLLGASPLSAALHDVNPRIRVLTAGPRPTNPSELLGSNRAADVLASARAQADFVLVDCPPILPVTDAAVLSAKVDGTVLIAKAGSTSSKDVAHALDMLRRVKAPVMGVVLNGATGVGGYGYRYQYQYTAAEVKAYSNGNGNGKGSENGGRRPKKGVRYPS